MSAFDPEAEISPFSSIPVAATPKTFLQNQQVRNSPIFLGIFLKSFYFFLQQSSPYGGGYGGYKGPRPTPAVPYYPNGYGAPDLYGHVVPRTKRKNGNKKNAKNSLTSAEVTETEEALRIKNKETEKKLSNGFKYSDYFGYGRPAPKGKEDEKV